jgi:hypothetical protein
MTILYRAYTENTISYQVALMNKYSLLMPTVAGNTIFDYMYLFFVVITIIVIIVTGSGRVRYGDVIHSQDVKKKKEKGISVDDKDDKTRYYEPKDILTVRFGQMEEDFED